jgi:4-aminobutyrate aminotransferase/(S)-3-amino-2-methylpropionate transaminase
MVRNGGSGRPSGRSVAVPYANPYKVRLRGGPPHALTRPADRRTLDAMDIPQERKLVTEVPGPKSRALFERREAAIPPGVANLHPVVTARASGAIVEDVDGNRLIDLATGISVLNVGHTAPEVVRAAQRQLELDTHTCFHVTANEPYIELAERLNAIVPIDGPVKTMFANSGAEAVENAVKIARRATGRPAVVAFDHAFHGRTLMGMSLTAKVMPYKQGMGPFAPEVYRLPFAYPYRWPSGPEHCAEEALEYALDEMHKHIGEENIACVVLEPIQGEGGFVVPAPGFVKGLAEFCAANGIVFVADEIQSGMGRAGRWFAIEDEDVRPDIITSAKSLGGGLPISAITGRAELMDAVHVGGLGGTYGGNPVAAAAALAVLDLIERDGLLHRAKVVGDTIMGRLGDLQRRHPQVGDVRGRGAMCAVELVRDPSTKEPLGADAMSAIGRNALERGVIVLTAGTYGNVVRLLPPLTIDESLLADGLDVVDEAVAEALA